MVHACQKYGKCASPEVSKIAGGISEKDAEDFARTKHDDLPERKVKKKKHKKKRLKSFREFRELQILENLNSKEKQMAGMTMNGDPMQVHQAAAQAGVNTSKYFRIMSKWLDEIEGKMNLKGQQSGEQSNNWHQMAVQVLQTVLQQAAGGKQQWQLNQQIKNAQNAQQKAASNNMPPVQQPQAQGGADVLS